MGQYFMIVNLDKQEYIYPHMLDSGLKFWEICANNIARVVPFLLRRSAEGGGGDANEWHTPKPLGVADDPASSNTCGRWAGDRIVIAGDYDNDDVEITEEEARRYGYNNEGLDRVRKPNGMIATNVYVLSQVRFKEISKWVARDYNKFIGDESMGVRLAPNRFIHGREIQGSTEE